MADQATAPAVPTESMADIAKALIAPDTELSAPETEEVQETVEENTNVEEQGLEEAPTEEVQEAGPPEEEVDEETEVERYLVTSEGVEYEATLDELVAAYSGDRAVNKRLLEASEARNEALKARDIAIAEQREAAAADIQRERDALRQQTEQLATAYRSIGDQLVAPQFEQPDLALLEKDPVEFQRQAELYRRDQERIQQQRQHMAAVVQQAQEQQRVEFEQRSAREVELMQKEVPALANPTYRETQVQRAIEVGQAIGYSENEVRQFIATDRRGAYALMLAAQGMENLVAASGGKPKAKPQTPPRTVAKRVARKTRQRQAVKERASQTGDYRDVAQTLIAPRG